MPPKEYGESASTRADPTRAAWAKQSVQSAQRIPYMSGRPTRTTVITVHDIADLKIALNTSTSLEDFIERT